MRYYYLYQFILETDIVFDMLIKFEQPTVSRNNIISLLVNEELPEEPEYVVTFREDIKYYLYPKRNCIYVQTSNLDYLYSSFFNIPMSVFCLFKDKVILHCNAVEIDSFLYCFSGNKAMGKTTLAMYLERYCPIFSDDCVAVDICGNKLFGYRAARTLKLCKNTYELTIKDGCYEKYYDSISQKAKILLPEETDQKLPLKKIFFMVRSDNSNFSFEKIESKVTKKILLIQSVVGKDYMEERMIQSFGHTILFSKMIDEIPFYLLKLPPISEYDTNINSFFKSLQA